MYVCMSINAKLQRPSAVPLTVDDLQLTAYLWTTLYDLRWTVYFGLLTLDYSSYLGTCHGLLTGDRRLAEPVAQWLIKIVNS